MANDIRRPFGGFGGQGAHGARARNRTMIVGAERAGQLRAGVFESQEQTDRPQELLPESFEQHGADKPSTAPSSHGSSDFQDVSSLLGDDASLQALDDIFDIPGEISYQAPQQPMAPEVPLQEPEPVSSVEPFPAVDPTQEIVQPKSFSVPRIMKAGGVVSPAPQSSWTESSTEQVEEVLRDDLHNNEYEEVSPALERAVQLSNARHGEEEEEYQMEARHDEVFWKSDSPLVGFFVSYDHDPRGAYVELRTGRLIVSSQREESGSCFVISDPSVSPMHAIMRVASNSVQVLDQLSEAGTRVKRGGSQEEIFLSGEKSTLSHGDIVFFGERKFYVLLVVRDDG